MNTDPKKTLGFVCGAFDLLHTGHILMLREAKSLCDSLLVGLHVDPSIERTGKNSPIQSIFERYTQLSACKYVDDIVIYETEEELLSILISYDIDRRILDESYRDNTSSVTGYNLRPICWNSRKHSYSSSELRKRIIDKSMRFIAQNSRLI
jgi:glycerol-3-phosphate cytidylyltransferase